uniref:Calmodulin-lysine N-methyltransferase n=1 Tax=Phaeomonas parva TaxID=124430 RepID=A0A7S1U585_9STRA|mmetsp:Transcript_31977/g.101810  ORF Transcript_31977/g.101810 Transcript_31977/m.101810 type:complete len:312 (+) Transcript_31977:112-1047(+)
MATVAEDWEDNFDAGLFLNEDYDREPIVLGGELEDGTPLREIRQDLYLSNAASTDWDLTGQVVWPVSIFLSYYIARNLELFAGRRVAELGAGCGLSGLVASQFAAGTCLTDGVDVVVRLLERNAALQKESGTLARPSGPDAEISVAQLLWGSETSLEAFLETFGVPEVLIGADVVCWPQYVSLNLSLSPSPSLSLSLGLWLRPNPEQVKPLVQTTKRLMQLRHAADPEGPPLVLHLGYVVRALNNHRLFVNACSEAGLRVAEVPDTAFVPHPRPEHVASNNELQLLTVTFDAAHPRAHEPVVFDEDSASLE